MFEPYGAVDAVVMMDKLTKRSRGFGFVTFADKSGMEEAIAEKHDTDMEGRKISVRSAIPESDIPPGALPGRSFRQLLLLLLLLLLLVLLACLCCKEQAGSICSQAVQGSSHHCMVVFVYWTSGYVLYTLPANLPATVIEVRS